MKLIVKDLNVIFRLFEENEELLHLFEKFRELRTKEAIVSSAELAEHATQVMHTLDEGIKGLADMDSFFDYVRHVGGTHRQVPGFKAENFLVRDLEEVCKNIWSGPLPMCEAVVCAS